jgi:hypothetical protein
MIQEAFLGVCKEAKPAEGIFLSLYVHTRPYGGPQEGGWWRDHYTLMAYQPFPTREAASAAQEKVNELAEQLTNEARAGHGEQCNREMDWLEARGLEADFLPEVDGETKYFTQLEDQPGANESHDMSGYE